MNVQKKEIRASMNGKHCQLRWAGFPEYNWKSIYLIFIFDVMTM